MPHELELAEVLWRFDAAEPVKPTDEPLEHPAPIEHEQKREEIAKADLKATSRKQLTMK